VEPTRKEGPSWLWERKLKQERGVFPTQEAQAQGEREVDDGSLIERLGEDTVYSHKQKRKKFGGGRSFVY